MLRIAAKLMDYRVGPRVVVIDGATRRPVALRLDDWTSCRPLRGLVGGGAGL